MKLLMIYTDAFSYTPKKQALDDEFADPAMNGAFENSLVGFIQVEKSDKEKIQTIETKLVKNLKWAARKNETLSIVLHSFSHLSESKAEPGITKQLFDRVEKRLFDAGYTVRQTPFGYFLDLQLKAPGHPLARLFKSF
jgi:hypothetical protein